MGRRWALLSVAAILAACGGEEAKGDAAAKGASAAASPQGEVEALLNQWCQAQTSGDLEGYSALYATDFKGTKRNKKGKTKTYDRKGWLKDRGKMFKKPLHVDCRAPKVSLAEADGTASVTFEQYWRSPSYADQGDKRLDLKKGDKGWRLVGEDMLNSKKWDTKQFRDGSAAPKATFKTDERKIKIPQMIRDMTTRQGPICYRKCIKKKPKDLKEVTDESRNTPAACENYCLQMHGNYE